MKHAVVQQCHKQSLLRTMHLCAWQNAQCRITWLCHVPDTQVHISGKTSCCLVCSNYWVLQRQKMCIVPSCILLVKDPGCWLEKFPPMFIYALYAYGFRHEIEILNRGIHNFKIFYRSLFLGNQWQVKKRGHLSIL